jgi:hypothetical protein
MPILSLELTGSIPSKKNSKVFSMRLKRLFPSGKYQQWHKHAENEILHQKYELAHNQHFKFPLMKCDSVTVTLYYGDMRRSDNSNKVESVHDLLVDAGILPGDGPNVIMRLCMDAPRPPLKGERESLTVTLIGVPI